MTTEQQVAALGVAVQTLYDGMQQMWGARNVNAQFDRLSTGLGIATRQSKETGDLITEFLMPAVKSILPRLDAIERAASYENGRLERFHEHDWPRAIESLEKIDKRIDGMERHVDRVDRSVEALSKRWDEATGSLSKRIDDVTTRVDNQSLKIRHLEDFELSLKVKIAIVVAVASTIGGGIVALAVNYIK